MPKIEPPSTTASGYLLSPDITNPNATVSIIDQANGRVVETRTGGLEFASVETRGGVSRLVTSDGKQLEQYPASMRGSRSSPGPARMGVVTSRASSWRSNRARLTRRSSTQLRSSRETRALQFDGGAPRRTGTASTVATVRSRLGRGTNRRAVAGLHDAPRTAATNRRRRVVARRRVGDHDSRPPAGRRRRVGSGTVACLDVFLDRYGSKWEDKILRAHLERGYTHISLSPQDSFAAGQSVDDYIAMSVNARQAGLFVHHLMRSKLYTANDPSLADVDALIDRLLEEDAMQVESPAWEMNYWSPVVVRQMIDHDAARIGTACRIMLHFYPHYISWQGNTETPTDFWKANFGKVDGVLYQCDPGWTAGMMAARANDCLDRLAPGGLWGLSDSGRGHPIDFTDGKSSRRSNFATSSTATGAWATRTSAISRATNSCVRRAGWRSRDSATAGACRRAIPCDPTRTWNLTGATSKCNE